MNTVKNLVNYVLEHIDIEDVKYTYSRMCIERNNLNNANYSLYNKISDLVDDFVSDNELSDEWFETEVGLIDDLFDELLKEN